MGTVGVIGAGMAGLACAAALASAGQSVTVFDKGRGPGGRLASRRTDAGRFDHGAPRVQATGAFADWLAPDALQWGKDWVGVPGMSALVQPFARALTVHQKAEVFALARQSDGWHVDVTGLPSTGPFDRLVVAIPPEQALRLIAPLGLGALVGQARMRPVWTAMAAFAEPLTLPSALPPNGPIAQAIRENDKPAREGSPDRWVLHANAEWTAAHLEREKPEAAALLLAALLHHAGEPDRTPLHLEGHRWRFGLTAAPLGRAFVLDDGAGLGLCGDWCLGDTAQAAFESGRALAEAMTRP